MSRKRQGITDRLLDNAKPERLPTTDPHDFAVLVRARRRVAHITNADRVTGHFADDHVVEGFGTAQIGLGQHRQFTLITFNPPAGRIEVLTPQGVFDILRCQSVRCQSLAVQPDAHRVTAFPADDDRSHPRDRLQGICQISIGVIR